MAAAEAADSKYKKLMPCLSNIACKSASLALCKSAISLKVLSRDPWPGAADPPWAETETTQARGHWDTLPYQSLSY